MKYNMIKYTTFTVKKNKFKKTDNQPDRVLSVATGKKDAEGKDIWVDIASGWVKTDTSGEQYISGQMKNVYTNAEGKVFDGFVIVSAMEFEKMSKVYEDYLIQQRNPGYPTPTSQGIDLSKTLQPDPAFDNVPEITPEMLDINPDDIPF